MMEQPKSCPHAVHHAIQADAAGREARQLRRLEIASAVEATTLLLLVFVAVPLKHLAGWQTGVHVLGPAHGLAFTAYVWTVIETVSGGGWSRGETIRLLLVALIPLGGYANIPFLARRASTLREAQ